MAQPMAFRAAYSDWRLIKTRGVIQVVLEVPLADANAAYNVLGGMPDASRENWFAIAPLKPPPAEKETSSTTPATPEVAHKPPSSAKRMDWEDVQPAAQAGIRCAEPRFREYLAVEHGNSPADSEEAAAMIRGLCGITSRSELSTNHKARTLWHSIDSGYREWAHL